MGQAPIESKRLLRQIIGALAEGMMVGAETIVDGGAGRRDSEFALICGRF